MRAAAWTRCTVRYMLALVNRATVSAALVAVRSTLRGLRPCRNDRPFTARGLACGTAAELGSVARWIAGVRGPVRVAGE